MLTSLSVRDVVLVDRLELGFGPGFVALTGETGAGKSILLGALGLALGRRAGRDLIREGAAQGSVTAVFEPSAAAPVHGLLEAHGIPRGDEIVIRRVVTREGRSRAFINDEQVGTSLLRQIGSQLVEIHGQHEQHGLLDASTHRELLDAFAGLDAEATAVRQAYTLWRAASDDLVRAEQDLERQRNEEDELRHCVEELEQLAPVAGEEQELAERRARLMNAERLAEAVQEALGAVAGSGGALERLAGAQRRIERSFEMAGSLLDESFQALERARVESAEAEAVLEAAAQRILGHDDRLDAVEERLFALRAAARKYRTDVDGLEATLRTARDALAMIDRGADAVEAAKRQAEEAHDDFISAAVRLSRGRKKGARSLARAVAAELAPLRLERARFRVAVDPLPEDAFGAAGGERIGFEIATNPGQTPGPLARIASGGELARLMLALKVVLARTNAMPTMIFDEVDTGIGGATAEAVGERLTRLGRDVQVLAVTHAPQVAARADHHLRVTKRLASGAARIGVEALAAEERREEIARMLAGARITDAARSAADSLIGQPA